MIDLRLLLLYNNTWNYLTICKQISSGLFKNIVNKIFTHHIYLIYMYKED